MVFVGESGISCKCSYPNGVKRFTFSLSQTVNLGGCSPPLMWATQGQGVPSEPQKRAILVSGLRCLTSTGGHFGPLLGVFRHFVCL